MTLHEKVAEVYRLPKKHMFVVLVGASKKHLYASPSYVLASQVFSLMDVGCRLVEETSHRYLENYSDQELLQALVDADEDIKPYLRNYHMFADVALECLR